MTSLVVDLVNEDDDDDEEDEHDDHQREALSVKENTVNLSQYKFQEAVPAISLFEETDSRLTSASANTETNKSKKTTKPRESSKSSSESASAKAAKPATARRRATTTTTSAAAKPPAKSKIEKDFDKLSAEEQQAFLRKVVPLYHVNSSAGAGEGASTLSAAQEEISTSSVNVNPTESISSAEEKELMRLRLELGDVLNREAECRAKEKKLRLSIRKLQRKLAAASNAQERTNEQVEDITAVLKYLFSRSYSEIDREKDSASDNGIARCLLWNIAQQREEVATLCEEKRVSAERDATLVSSQMIANEEPARRESVQDDHAGPSVLSQLLNVMQTSSDDEVDNEDEGADNNIEIHANNARCDASLSSSIADEWVEILLEDTQTLLRNDSQTKRNIVSAVREVRANGSEALSLLHRLTEERLAETHEGDDAQLRSLLLSRILQLLLRRLTQSNARYGLESECVMIIAALCATEMKEDFDDQIAETELPPQSQQTTIARKRDSTELVLSPSPRINSNKRKKTAEENTASDSQDAVCIDLVSPAKHSVPLSQRIVLEDIEERGRKDLLSRLKNVQSKLVSANTTANDNTSLPPFSRSLFSQATRSSTEPTQTSLSANAQSAVCNSENPFALAGRHVSFSSSSSSMTSSIPTASSTNVFGLNFPSSVPAVNSLVPSQNPPPLISTSSSSSSFSVPTSHSIPFSMPTATTQTTMPSSSSAPPYFDPLRSTITPKGPLTAAALKQFLQSHLDIYQDILMFIPISLDDVLNRLTTAGYRIAKPALLQLLDSLSVFVSPDYGGRRHKNNF